MDTNKSQTENDQPATTHLQIDPRLIEILVCPLTRTTLIYDKDKQELVSKAANLAYPIRDGIPIMLTYEARRLEP
ncbi:MAG: Trm112 family protein [Hyphomicrobiales bacterium]|nr:Trm112 family protein [Hyphomicrobiales bacterium]